MWFPGTLSVPYCHPYQFLSLLLVLLSATPAQTAKRAENVCLLLFIALEGRHLTHYGVKSSLLAEQTSVCLNILLSKQQGPFLGCSSGKGTNPNRNPFGMNALILAAFQRGREFPPRDGSPLRGF